VVHSIAQEVNWLKYQTAWEFCQSVPVTDLPIQLLHRHLSSTSQRRINGDTHMTRANMPHLTWPSVPLIIGFCYHRARRQARPHTQEKMERAVRGGCQPIRESMMLTLEWVTTHSLIGRWARLASQPIATSTDETPVRESGRILDLDRSWVRMG
jgi:hypothetical protein